MLRGRTVVVGVSGGIAAYRACELVRWLKQREAAVIVVMTPAATEFVTPLTFETLSGNPVVHGLWGRQRADFSLPPSASARMRGRVEHVDVAEAADCIVVAPATADLMARLVHGEAPDALTATVLAARGPVVICPSMDVRMWRHSATRANLAVLEGSGAVVVPPEHGELASGLVGPGRLAAIETIGETVARLVATRASMEGLRVLVGAGRTEEPLDPVRVLTNRSSGRMGRALAEAARDRGAEVTLVAGPMSVEPPAGVDLVPVRTAAEMDLAMRDRAPRADLILMAAAVADFRPVRSRPEKIKRDAGSASLELVPTPDILAGLGARRRPGQTLVGFALETSRGLERARRKLVAKALDLVVLNSPREGLGGEKSRVTLVLRDGNKALPSLPKREVAERILERVLEIRAGSPRARPGRGRGGRKS